MKTNHSKGPWQEDGSEYSRIASSGGGIVAEIWPDADSHHRLSEAQIKRKMADFYVVLSSPDMLAFIDRMARFTTPEDEFAEDPQGYEDADEMVADMDDERLCGEYATFMEMIREARKVAAKARGEAV